MVIVMSSVKELTHIFFFSSGKLNLWNVEKDEKSHICWDNFQNKDLQQIWISWNPNREMCFNSAN